MNELLEDMQRAVEAAQDDLKVNDALIDIHQDNLMPYVDAALKEQLAPKAYACARHRISPINFFKKAIDKPCKIYKNDPRRYSVSGNERVQEMINFYSDAFDLQNCMRLACSYLNAARSFLIQPYLDSALRPRLRVLRPSMFVPFSTDPNDSSQPTHFILLNRVEKKTHGKAVYVYYVYSVTGKFFIFDSESKIRIEEMARLGFEDGQLPIDTLPFVYVKNVRDQLMPKADRDSLQMATNLSILLTDINFISMFSGFPIFYGIGVKSQGLDRGPNAFWDVKPTDEATMTDKEPKVGVITTTSDIPSLMASFKEQLMAWLDTRGLKAHSGSAGQADQNSLSGISKMMDELDSSECRSENVNIFAKVERDLFRLVNETLTPYWLTLQAKVPGVVTPSDFDFEVEFEDQKPVVSLESRIKNAADLKREGLLSDFQALKMVFPSKTDEELTILLPERNPINGTQQIA